MKCIKCNLYEKLPDRRICKTCKYAVVRAWKEAHRDYVRAYDRAASRRRLDRRKRGSLQKKAHRLVSIAVKAGVLFRPELCEQCSQPPHKIEAHHDDYHQPLKVRWLCRSCHKLIH